MKNWKTSLMGFLVGFWILAQPIIANGSFDFARDWKQLVLAAIATIWGIVQKDNNVTGGTVAQ